MKRYFFTAVAMTIAAAASMPAAQAADYGTINLQQRRYEVLDRGGSKAVENIQSARLEHLDNQSKGIESIQSTRLEHLDSQSKSIAKEQVSTPEEVSKDATLVDLIRHNRDSRSSK